MSLKGEILRQLTTPKERPHRRPRLDEDVLVRALDYCDESGMRFGQLLVNVMQEHLIENHVMAPAVTEFQKALVIERTYFFIENAALEEAIRKYVGKHRARHDALNRLAKDAMDAGLYDAEDRKAS